MSTIATAGTSREARRRRITERGTDRLALITGKIQSLPVDPDQSTPSTRPSDQIPADSSEHEDSSSLPNQESVSRRRLSRQDNISEITQPLLPNNDKGQNRAMPLFPGVEEQISQVSSPLQNLDTGSSIKDLKSITSGEIISALSASEYTRTCCDVAAAFLVILSYIRFPILGWTFFRNTIVFRPVYLLLLTNMSIVFGRIILGKRGAQVRASSSFPMLDGGNGVVDQLGKALEIGLLLQNVIGALFMDFGIYVVVLICGLSMAR